MDEHLNLSECAVLLKSPVARTRIQGIRAVCVGAEQLLSLQRLELVIWPLFEMLMHECNDDVVETGLDYLSAVMNSDPKHLDLLFEISAENRTAVDVFLGIIARCQHYHTSETPHSASRWERPPLTQKMKEFLHEKMVSDSLAWSLSAKVLILQARGFLSALNSSRPTIPILTPDILRTIKDPLIRRRAKVFAPLNLEVLPAVECFSDRDFYIPYLALGLLIDAGLAGHSVVFQALQDNRPDVVVGLLKALTDHKERSDSLFYTYPFLGLNLWKLLSADSELVRGAVKGCALVFGETLLSLNPQYTGLILGVPLEP